MNFSPHCQYLRWIFLQLWSYAVRLCVSVHRWLLLNSIYFVLLILDEWSRDWRHTVAIFIGYLCERCLDSYLLLKRYLCVDDCRLDDCADSWLYLGFLVLQFYVELGTITIVDRTWFNFISHASNSEGWKIHPRLSNVWFFYRLPSEG